VAHRDGLFFVYAKNLSDVVIVEMKIGDYPKLVKALSGKYQHKRYGGDLFHDGKCRIK
jgi:hypothetical protein